MPLTPKGEAILHHMEQEYGNKRGESVFNASRNAGTITGVDGAAGAITSPSLFGGASAYQSVTHEQE